jgi:uncharacterized protein YbbC (DUF1343 family)
MGSIYWYPSICFFEGTNITEGRGTDKPFQVFGAPSLPKNMYAFTPVARQGASSPKYMNQLCYGWNVSATGSPFGGGNIHLQFLLEAYKLFPDKTNFFIKPKSNNTRDYFFNKLAGNAALMQQIIDGRTEDEIRASWQPDLNSFKQTRKKYLLYDDFE